MRIAQVAPLFESVPPKLYGGTERVVSYLTEALVGQGHQVTVFASGDSQTSATLVPCGRQALRLDSSVEDHVPHHLVMLEKLLQRQNEFDIIHFHTDMLHMPLFRKIIDRTVTTLHNRMDRTDIQSFYREFTDAPLVSVSDAQRSPIPLALWAGTVHHGLPKDLHRLHKTSGDYLAFLGRISPEKRPDDAIEIAIRSGIPLKIAAKVPAKTNESYDSKDREYFETKIRHLLDHPLIEFVGEISESEKSDFLGNAKALLFPIKWPEPFGLVMIEAMAVGTPVIACPYGSVPEVLEHGVTGMIVNSVDEAVQAVGQLDSLDRAAIRRRFEARFTSERMAQDYVKIYRSLVDQERLPKVNGLSRAARLMAGTA